MRRFAAFGLLVMRRFAGLLLWGVWCLNYLSLSSFFGSGGFFAPSKCCAVAPNPARAIARASQCDGLLLLGFW